MVNESGFTQKCVDDIIGEAVITLLKSGGEITTSTLLSQLTEMAKVSADQERKEACLQSIVEIKQSISKNYQARSQFLRNQSSLFESGNNLHRYDTKH
ncbi:hypothetical protein [Rosenbergiella nectarea]|uniref:hypothetical protein n=1 Tax=Rosenbergiella nectarea TaxID=988801 RepID=UPI001F4E49F6|nr:hypothetical protein [Rosenbergiella nectarea]